MTVRASDDAFRDFGKNTVPAVARHHVAHIVTLNARHVVQFQHDRIVFAAVDARMGTEVLEQQFALLLLVTRLIGPATRFIFFAVSGIIRRVVYAPALPTDISVSALLY